MSDNLINMITLDELDEEQRQIAECIGIENYQKLIKEFAGGALYIPKAETVTLERRNQLIKQKFNGYNYRELSLLFGLSSISIRRILKLK